MTATAAAAAAPSPARSALVRLALDPADDRDGLAAELDRWSGTDPFQGGDDGRPSPPAYEALLAATFTLNAGCVALLVERGADPDRTVPMPSAVVDGAVVPFVPRTLARDLERAMFVTNDDGMLERARRTVAAMSPVQQSGSNGSKSPCSSKGL